MTLTGTTQMDAERAFDRVTRSRRRAALARRLRRGCGCGLAVVDGPLSGSAVRGTPGVVPIPVDRITGTLEPSRAAQFDCAFRPVALMRDRWQRVWLAEQRGTLLPPIAVVPVGDGYAIRDGHHRVSVARARGDDDRRGDRALLRRLRARGPAQPSCARR